MINEIIKRQLNALSLLSEPLPIQYTMKLDLLWLGRFMSTDLLEVAIREPKKELGWLYKKASLVFFIVDDQQYQCWLHELKNLTEEKLKEKKFSSDPQVNHLRKSSDGRICGYIEMSEVIAISKKVI